ncbi:MAG TPA: MATE family efflux transporter [Spirochaetia bacterium]|nr:MATE family efflux transporter [Spirochaetia bacterium]HRZ65389.1 MATE family efflux transporter [Spirochaetia bacterium]
MDALATGRPGQRAVFLSYALPALAGTLVSSVSVLADGLFVGRILGAGALAAVNLTLPIFYVFLAAGVMIAVGGGTLANHRLGAKDGPGASRLASGTMLLLAAAGLGLTLLLGAFLGPAIGLLGARGEVAGQVREYLAPLLLYYAPVMLNVGVGAFLRAGGRPGLSLAAGAAGAACDIALDWLLIARLGLGLRGAALSSAAGAALQLLLGLAALARACPSIKPARPALSRGELGSILANGSSELVGQLSVTIVAYAYNRILLARMGVAGVAAYTISGYLCFLSSMLVLGFGQGLWPLAGRAWGGGEAGEARSWLSLAMRWALGAAAAAAAPALLFPGPLAALFARAGEEASSGLAARALFFTALSLLPAAYSSIASAYLTAIGDAAGSAAVASLRGLVLICLFVFLFPLLFGDLGVWLALPASEACTLAVSIALLARPARPARAGERPPR